jgi:oxygen-dependent protoporphyrinogen oxidase
VNSVAVLGTGISGLSTAFYLSRYNPDLQITLFDKKKAAGGVIQTELKDGFVLEGGPDSFLTQKIAAFELSADLGLTNELQGSRDDLRKTFIFHEGKLKRLPEGMFMMIPSSPVAFLKSDLISWYGKFSATKDLFTLPDQNDLTVADWVEKRFGTELLNQIAEPLLAGVYGGDINRLSLASGLPQIWELQKRGSLIRQVIGRKKENQSLFTSFRNGMQTLTDALTRDLHKHQFILGTEVNRIDKYDGKWMIQDRQYDALVLSTSTIPEIDCPYGSEIRLLLNSIQKNSAIVILMGFKNLVREGFGWLVPRSERHFCLACTYSSNKFANRSPDHHLLLRLFVGGSQAENWLDRSDEELIDRALDDLRRIASINDPPLFAKVYRWHSAMPEFAVGHQKIIEQIRNTAKLEESLFVANNIMNGVGIPDCIAAAKATAQQLCHMKSS